MAQRCCHGAAAPQAGLAAQLLEERSLVVTMAKSSCSPFLVQPALHPTVEAG
jgi:hypothetical protein